MKLPHGSVSRVRRAASGYGSAEPVAPLCPRCRSAMVANVIMTVWRRGRSRRKTLINRFVCVACGHRWAVRK